MLTNICEVLNYKYYKENFIGFTFCQDDWLKLCKKNGKQKEQKASSCSSLDRSLQDIHINHISHPFKYLCICNIYFLFLHDSKNIN